MSEYGKAHGCVYLLMGAATLVIAALAAVTALAWIVALIAG